MNIVGYMDADSVPALFHPADTHANTTAVVTINCTQPMCRLDGITMSGAAALGMSYDHSRIGPAVRVYSGGVRSVTLLDSAGTGSMDVVDAAGQPAGSSLSKIPGGLRLVAPAANTTDASLLARESGHALLVGLPGESAGRLAVDSDGSIRFGSGGSRAFDTQLDRVIAKTVPWDPPALGGQGGKPDFAKLVVALPEATPGDIASASHTALGEADVQLTASASDGKVVVILRALGRHETDVPGGSLKVMLTKVQAT